MARRRTRHSCGDVGVSPATADRGGHPLGRVVILNGTTSAGKTTLVDLFLARRHAAGECWLTTGCDDYIRRLPVPWHGLPKYQGPFMEDGFRLERIDASRMEVRLGPVWQMLLSTYR